MMVLAMSTVAGRRRQRRSTQNSTCTTMLSLLAVGFLLTGSSAQGSNHKTKRQLQQPTLSDFVFPIARGKGKSPSSKKITKVPTVSPAPSSSLAPSALPSDAPTLVPTHSPSTSHSPSYTQSPSSAAFSSWTETTSDTLEPFFVARCDGLPLERGDIFIGTIHFDYEMHVDNRNVLHETQITPLEIVLNGQLASHYLNGCHFQRPDFQVYQLSSLERDTVTGPCRITADTCRTLRGSVIVQTFSLRPNRRALLDAQVQDSFATTIRLLMEDKDSPLLVNHIVQLDFVSLAGTDPNDGPPTFEGVDPESVAAATDQSLSKSGPSHLGWGASILGMAVLSLVAVLLLARRRHTGKALNQTLDEERYTYDDDHDGVRFDEHMVEDSLEGMEVAPPAYVLDDLLSEPGSLVWENHGHSLVTHNPNPPTFTPVKKPSEPYRSYSTPDTLVL